MAVTGELCAAPRSLCMFAGVEHRHCGRCGLAVGADGQFCSFCWSEILRPRRAVETPPVSRRRRRPDYWQGDFSSLAVDGPGRLPIEQT